jgi:hypothetical protein
MDPRDAVLEEHERLRCLLRDVLHHAQAARDGNREAAVELSRRVSELQAALRRHAINEDQHSGPLLESLDARGAERRKQLSEAHAREEDAVACLRTAASVEQIVTCVADIVAALGWEERELLTPETLRPDAIVVNQSDG